MQSQYPGSAVTKSSKRVDSNSTMSAADDERPGGSGEGSGDYVPDEADFGPFEPTEEILAGESPPPGDPLLTMLAKIEHNTGVVRAWTRAFGWVWLISLLAYLLLVLMVLPRHT